MNFTAIRGRFVLGTARVKALGWLEKNNQKRKTIFTTSRFVTLTTFSSNLGAIVELGQHQRGDLTVFRRVEFTAR